MEDVLSPSGGPVDGKGHCQTAGPFFIPCLRCGECCTKYQVRVDLNEVAGLADGLGMSVEDFIEAYADKRWPGERSFLVRQENGHCIFLSAGVDDSGMAGCRIHPFKPASCREWDSSLSRPECRTGLMKIMGVLPGQSSGVVSPEEGKELFQRHLEVPAASRRN
jgi:Fe-S-cluster containining protein